MKQYQEVRDFVQESSPVLGYTIGAAFIPNEASNRNYQIMQAELAANPPEAEILPAVEEPPTNEPTVLAANVVAAQKFTLLDGDGNEVGSIEDLWSSIEARVAALESQ